MANPKLIEMLGYSSFEELSKINLSYEGYENQQERNEFIRILNEHDKIYGYESAWFRADNSIVHVRESARAIKDINGKILYIEGSVEDITKRKMTEHAPRKKEDLYRQMFNNHSAVMLLIDPESGDIVDANHAASEYYGYQHENITKMNLRDIIVSSSKSVELYLNSVSDVKQSHFYFKHKLSSSEVKSVEAYSGPVVLEGKNLIYSIIHDITDRAFYEKALKESERHLREANASKDKFLSIISHDLRSPFNSLLGITEYLSQYSTDMSSEEIKEFALNMHQSTKNVYTLLENLLQWSRLQTGRIEYEPMNIILRDLTNQVLKLFEQAANYKTITLTNELPHDVLVNADYNMLDSILRNLVTNAIKFTRRNGEIKIWLMSINDYAEICIEDSGIGMTENEITQLFRIDVHHTDVGTEKEKGTGLGLILCKEFIERNKGKIRIESKPDVGTKFIFTIPCAI
jgi:PAS domain S-box-containing protein